MPFFSRGGGIALNAIELSVVLPNCKNGQGQCQISTPQSTITNSGTIVLQGSGANDISIAAQVNTFINYGTIGGTMRGNQSISFDKAGRIGHFINYGTIGNSFWISNNSAGMNNFTNYGTLNGGISNEVPTALTLNNFGYMWIWGPTWSNLNTNGTGKILIQNYKVLIDESATTFNVFNGPVDVDKKSLSHLKISGSSVTFKDKKSKILLDFGTNFEFGKTYLIDKVATDTGGNAYTALGVDFSRLSPFNDIYTITKSGTNGFKVELKKPQYGTIGTLYKSNIRTMNNFQTISDSMIYPHKYKSTNSSVRKRVIRRVRKTANLFDTIDSPSLAESFAFDSPSLAEGDKGGGFNTQNNTQFSNLDCHESLRESRNDKRDGESLDSSLCALLNNDDKDKESLDFSLDLFAYNDTFFYKSNSLLLANLQEQRQRRMRNSTQNLNTRNMNRVDSTNQSVNPNPNQSTNRRIVSNINTNQNSNYYFILTPFVNHNYFFESGRYNLSGLEYGFVSAFNGKENDSNSLGAHFIFSYASLKDSNDSIFNITTMNLNMGANYKLDLIWDMYVKARIDGYYFLNEVKSKSIKGSIKPNTIGFGASVSYGKDFNFGNGEILGISGGIDYKGLYADDWTMSNMADSSVYEKYNKQLYNLLYVDLSVDYSKYFSTSIGLWGLNTRLGVKANATANKLAKSKIAAFNNTRNVNMTLDNDLILAYLNIAGSYILQSKDFDMEFSLAFYGNYGNRVMSNGGGFEWRVGW